METSNHDSMDIIGERPITDSPITVLHVDDDETFLDFVSTRLERESDRIGARTATSAREGLSHLETADCVVSDYSMPGMDGIEFLEQVREEYPDLPFILYTETGSEEIASEAISAGVTDYLQKESGDAQYAVLCNRILNAVEQYRTEQALNESRKRYRSLVEESPHAICVVQDRTIVFANNPFLYLVNAHQRDEVYGTEYMEFVHPDFEELAAERIERIEHQGAPVDRRTGKITTLDGRVEPVEVVATPFSSNDTTGIQIVFSHPPKQEAQDQEQEQEQGSEREQELSRTKELFQKIFEQSHDAIMIVDLEEEEFLEVNPAACEMLGYDRDELLELHPEDIHPEDIDRVREEFLSQVLEEGSGWTDELDCLTKDGNHVPTEISGAVLELATDKERPTSMVAILRDISEREAYRQDLEQELDRLDAFASFVSHDLRNPLNVANGRLELAREECDSEHLDHVASSLDRMETLITDVLTFAHEGQTVGEMEPVALDTVVEQCWGNVDTTGATLQIESNLAFEADRSRLAQVFENLFRNAIEHGGETVTITVGALDDGFYIEDDGPGIPTDERDRIFDLGYSTSEDSTGLGLPIVKNIVDTHGWEIAVTESDAGGTRFEITNVSLTAD